MNYDIVLASIPRNDYRAPYQTPFLLKAVLEKNGFRCKAVDWNRDLYDSTENVNIFNKEDIVFNSKTKFDEFWNDSLKDTCSRWVDELEAYSPKWFGISFVSQRNQYMGVSLLEMVRDRLPTHKNCCGWVFCWN